MRCPNNSEINAKKIFVTFPKGQIRRSEWFKALGVRSNSSRNLYVCEDHFDVSILKLILNLIYELYIFKLNSHNL